MIKTLFKKKRILIIAFLFSLKGFAQTVPIQQSALAGCWLDSYEENTTNTVKIYRHCNYKEFPASRFRFRMELNSNGMCRYLYAAPNDAHKMVKGSWTFNSQSGLLEIKNAQGNRVNTFKVIRVKLDLLEIEKEK